MRVGLAGCCHRSSGYEGAQELECRSQLKNGVASRGKSAGAHIGETDKRPWADNRDRFRYERATDKEQHGREILGSYHETARKCVKRGQDRTSEASRQLRSESVMTSGWAVQRKYEKAARGKPSTGLTSHFLPYWSLALISTA